MSQTLSKDSILAALSGLKAPDGKTGLVAAGLVSEVVIANGKVYFSITVDPEHAKAFEPIRSAAERTVAKLPGVQSVNAVLTAERAPKSAAPAAARSPAPGPAQRGPAPRREPQNVPGIAHIIAVASGKGGVGKSTTAVNLALALDALGHRAGILDADIYGPSMPRLLGIRGKPREVTRDGHRMLGPMQGYGLPVMSMGFLVEEGTPVIWRGPMVISALTQMLREVDWGALDVLVVDMPPGTGDVQLTMAQQVPLSGAVIVSTPQDLALIDARKGLAMFQQVSVPVLGIVENMSYFVCPSCGTRSDIFGTGGARREAERLGVPFLGEVPLHIDIRETSDLGQPIVATAPDSPHAEAYLAIAGQVWEGIAGSAAGPARKAPRIVIE